MIPMTYYRPFQWLIMYACELKIIHLFLKNIVFFSHNEETWSKYTNKNRNRATIKIPSLNMFNSLLQIFLLHNFVRTQTHGYEISNILYFNRKKTSSQISFLFIFFFFCRCFCYPKFMSIEFVHFL